MLLLKTDLSLLFGVGVWVHTRVHDASARVSPRGEIDCCSVFALDQAMCCLPDGLESILLDMKDVTFMDSAGLHFLDRLSRYGDERRADVRSMNWHGQPHRLLEFARLHHWTEHTQLEESRTGSARPRANTAPTVTLPRKP